MNLSYILSSFFRFASPYKGRAPALSTVTVEGELGNHKHCPALIPEERFILPAVLEDPQVHDLLSHPEDISFFPVIRPDPKKDTESPFDLPRDPAVNLDPGTVDSLNYRP